MAHANGAVSSIFLKVKKLSGKNVSTSTTSPLSAGYDLSRAVATAVPARRKALVPTDLAIAIREGTCARAALQSGLAWKHSIDVMWVPEWSMLIRGVPLGFYCSEMHKPGEKPLCIVLRSILLTLITNQKGKTKSMSVVANSKHPL